LEFSERGPPSPAFSPDIWLTNVSAEPPTRFCFSGCKHLCGGGGVVFFLNEKLLELLPPLWSAIPPGLGEKVFFFTPATVHLEPGTKSVHRTVFKFFIDTPKGQLSFRSFTCPFSNQPTSLLCRSVGGSPHWIPLKSLVTPVR